MENLAEKKSWNESASNPPDHIYYLLTMPDNTINIIKIYIYLYIYIISAISDGLVSSSAMVVMSNTINVCYTLFLSQDEKKFLCFRRAARVRFFFRSHGRTNLLIFHFYIIFH